MSAPGAAGLRIGGLTRWTSIDFPGRLAAVVFCQGCPWRCSYCHNAGLQDPAATGALAWEEVRSFLRSRQGLLDGVVFSGGEPTLQAHLSDALHEVKALGFATALHTAGMYPERLQALLPALDWVGLDVKAPWHRLDSITGVPHGAARVQASLRALLASGVGYECRTTWEPGLFAWADLQALAGDLAARGVTHWALQPRAGCVPDAQLQALSAGFAHFTLRPWRGTAQRPSISTSRIEPFAQGDMKGAA